MTIRVATFNVENLFRRPRLLRPGGPSGQDALEAFTTLSGLLEHDPYTDEDKGRITEILRKYEVTDAGSPSRPFLVNTTRGKLYTVHEGGGIEVTAKGRRSWVGWVELVRDDIDWRAVENTARVIAEVDADILVVVEAEDRLTLQRFADQVLQGAMTGAKYPYNILVDGNDTRGIDIGLLSRHPIAAVRPHIFDGPPGQPVFNRDCPEFEVRLPGGESLWILGNHFKSKGFGAPAETAARRRAQAERAAEIYLAALERSPYVALVGDLNDSPDSPPIRHLATTGLRDVMSHPAYSGRPGTYKSGNTLKQKIDYLMLSPQLWERVRAVDVERRGVWAPQSIQPFSTVTSQATQASDHGALHADIDL